MKQFDDESSPQAERLGGKSIPQFSEDWDLPESSVWLYIKQGRIRVVRAGRHTRIPYSEEKRIEREGIAHPVDGEGSSAA